MLFTKIQYIITFLINACGLMDIYEQVDLINHLKYGEFNLNFEDWINFYFYF